MTVTYSVARLRSSLIRLAWPVLARLLALARPGWNGHCPICEADVRFIAVKPWHRDWLVCSRCRSIPRERALMQVMASRYPDWREMRIHESSPGDRGVSHKLGSQCKHYTVSQFLPDQPSGLAPDGRYNENLEAQTFADESFDLVITQDVFEHLFHPGKAIAEIVRTLKPGGAHIMSVPMPHKNRPTLQRASLGENGIVHHLPPLYHSSPVDTAGSLLVADYGYDLAELLSCHGAPTEIITLDSKYHGICGEMRDIVVTERPDADAARRDEPASPK